MADTKKGKSLDASRVSSRLPEPFHPKYTVIRSEGWSLMAASSASYDKAIITLTTAFLGFIFVVINVNPVMMHCMSFLIFILACLIGSIFFSLMSFWFDQIYGDSIMNYAYRYYVDGLEEYRLKKHWSYCASMITKILAGALFFLSLILFSILFISNLDGRKSVSVNQALNISSQPANNVNLRQ